MPTNPSGWRSRAQFGIYFQVYKVLVSAGWEKLSQLREFDCNVWFSKLILSLENMIIANKAVSTSPTTELQGNISYI